VTPVTSADLLLHPVRLRIVQAFLGDRALTTTALREELADIPPTSLYRHVARLVAAGVLMVVAERRVRGAVERRRILASILLPGDEATRDRDAGDKASHGPGARDEFTRGREAGGGRGSAGAHGR
jgi:Helix-turn-helix domain